MNHELFSSMHDMLDYIIEHYDHANDSEKLEYCQHIHDMKATNDAVMDHWVAFEEKLALFFEKYMQYEQDGNEFVHILPPLSASKQQESVELSKKQYSNSENEQQLYADYAINKMTCNACDLIDIEHPDFEKAIGYYRLLMFKHASQLFQNLLQDVPECNRARLFYAMCLLHLQNWEEAKRQFQLIIVLSDFPKWLALSYNALGCLQAIACHMGEAEKLFRRAYQIYPQFDDALKNLECCTKGNHEISLYFGSTELISM